MGVTTDPEAEAGAPVFEDVRREEQRVRALLEVPPPPPAAPAPLPSRPLDGAWSATLRYDVLGCLRLC